MMTPFKRLQKTPDMSTDDLISQIEAKDRRFRLAQTVFMIGTFLALIIVIGLQNSTISNFKEQAASQNKQAVEARDKILRRLDCMTIFFSQKDRTNLTIKNIDQCTLEKDGDIQRFFTNNSDGTTTNNKTEQPEGQQTPKASAP